MKMVEGFFSTFPKLAKNPNLAIGFPALAVPIVLLHNASKFVSAPRESLIVFGLLSLASLVFSTWVVARVDDHVKISSSPDGEE